MRKFTLFVVPFLFSAFVLSSNSSAAMKTTLDQCFPKNALFLFDDENAGNITEADFNQIIDGVITYFRPFVELHQAKLSCNKHWKDKTVNAFASQSGNKWTVDMFGGLARRPEVTADGFAMVVCHELGHHLGGFAFYQGEEDEWAAAEGQADYYASQACARALWKADKAGNAKARETVDAVAKAACDNTWKSEDEQNLCYRIALGGQSLANLLAVLGGSDAPKFDTPDQSKVTQTETAHPAAQCRLDTYFQGGLCTRDFDLNVIPGRSHPDGQQSAGAERDAAKASCFVAEGFTVGARPACWFKESI